MAQFNNDKMEALMGPVMDYAKELSNADKIRVAAYLLGSVNYVQQCADINADAMWHAAEETNLFDHAEQGDPMPAGYHLHNMLENLADDFDTLADIVAECDDVDPRAAALAAALAKLTPAECILLGLPVAG